VLHGLAGYTQDARRDRHGNRFRVVGGMGRETVKGMILHHHFISKNWANHSLAEAD